MVAGGETRDANPFSAKDNHMAEEHISSWPGARQPTDHDVPQGDRLPDRAFLDQFRDALLAHEDSKGCKQRFSAHTLPLDSDGIHSSHSFVYPLSALAQFPDLPSHEGLIQARNDFGNTLHQHIYLNKLPIASGTGSPLPPDLLLACACNGSGLTWGSTSDASALFFGAYQLCTAMVETDNRRSRSTDTIVAVSVPICLSDSQRWARANHSSDSVVCHLGCIDGR